MPAEKEALAPMNIAETVERLLDRNHRAAYQALQELQQASAATEAVYPYMARFIDMLDSDNSYVRTRGLTLLACNAKWDRENRLDAVMNRYLEHITDEKPITARQCVKLLPMVAREKPDLKETILAALQQADLSGYDSSMRALMERDVQKALEEIAQEK